MNRNHERQQVEMDRRHLAHKKSQLTELKDQLLTRQMNPYQIEKALGLKHATAWDLVKKAERSGLIEIAEEKVFKPTGLKTKSYRITVKGFLTFWQLALREVVDKHPEMKKQLDIRETPFWLALLASYPGAKPELKNLKEKLEENPGLKEGVIESLAQSIDETRNIIEHLERLLSELSK